MTHALMTSNLITAGTCHRDRVATQRSIDTLRAKADAADAVDAMRLRAAADRLEADLAEDALTILHPDRTTLAIEPVPFHADPVLAAIERHEEAWSVFQVAPDGEPSMQAEDECDASRAALLATACATRPGAFALLRHLRWWLAEEEPNASAYSDEWRIAQAREADLTLLLGCDAVHRIPVALPSGRLAGPARGTPAPITIEAGPAPALVPLSRVAATAGEALACLVLIGGGCVLTGIASLL